MEEIAAWLGYLKMRKTDNTFQNIDSFELYFSGFVQQKEKGKSEP